MNLTRKPTKEEILRHVIYKDGVLYHKCGAPFDNKKGRHRINICGKQSVVSTLVWFLEYGEWHVPIVIEPARGNQILSNLRRRTTAKPGTMRRIYTYKANVGETMVIECNNGHINDIYRDDNRRVQRQKCKHCPKILSIVHDLDTMVTNGKLLGTR